MPDFAVEQALYHRPDGGACTRVAQSLAFREEWHADLESLAVGFGERPAGVKCPTAVLARPLGNDAVAVAHVADQPGGSGLAFHFLILPRGPYTRYIGDPFRVAERFPPDWQARGQLASLSWPEQPPPRRTVEDIRRVLTRVKAAALREGEDPATVEPTVENAESPALLGGVQILVDGGRVAFERPAPDTPLIKGLWTLLPASTRSTLWPASFAFGNALGFDAMVAPRAKGPEFEGYYDEEQAAEYPPGRYELGLQTAAEHGDQAEVDALLSRRSFAETFRLALTLLILFAVLALAAKIFEPPPLPEPPVDFEKKAAAAAGIIGVADPITASAMLQHGNALWLKKDRR
jgi:hypothetical protein